MARPRKRKPSVADYRCLRQFRHRRLLAFLWHDKLPATFDALKHETRVFFDMRFLQRLLVRGRWREARGYVKSFLPCQQHQKSDEAYSALELINRLNVLEDLEQGMLGGDDTIYDLEKQIQAIPSTMADPDYTEALRFVFNAYEHPGHWNPEPDWRVIRLKSSQIVKDFISRAPEFRRLLRLPRCLVNPRYTIPLGYGCRGRHQRSNMGQMPASLLARRFLQKERRPPPLFTEGSSSEPMNFQDLFDDLIDGKLEVRGHSKFSSEGIPAAPVVPCMGENFVKLPGNAATKHLNQEDSCAESSCGAKHPRTTKELFPDDVDAPPGWMDPVHVFKKVENLECASTAVIRLLLNSPHGPDRGTMIDKVLELDRKIHELKVDSMKAMLHDRGSIETTAAP